MKLYKEPLIIGVSFVVAGVMAIWTFIALPNQSVEPTVDHKTPLPVLMGNQTISQLEQTPGIGAISEPKPKTSIIQKMPPLDLRSPADRLKKQPKHKKVKPLPFGAQMELQLQNQGLPTLIN